MYMLVVKMFSKYTVIIKDPFFLYAQYIVFTYCIANLKMK